VSQHGSTCPQPGNTHFIHSWLATSLRSLATILVPLHSYHYRIFTSRVAIIPTDVPSYDVIHRDIPFYDNRSCNFKYVSHTEFYELPHFDASRHTIYTNAMIQILEALIKSAKCLGMSIELQLIVTDNSKWISEASWPGNASVAKSVGLDCTKLIRDRIGIEFQH